MAFVHLQPYNGFCITAKGTSTRAEGAKVTPEDGWAADAIDVTRIGSDGYGNSYKGVRGEGMLDFAFSLCDKNQMLHMNHCNVTLWQLATGWVTPNVRGDGESWCLSTRSVMGAILVASVGDAGTVIRHCCLVVNMLQHQQCVTGTLV